MRRRLAALAGGLTALAWLPIGPPAMAGPARAVGAAWAGVGPAPAVAQEPRPLPPADTLAALADTLPEAQAAEARQEERVQAYPERRRSPGDRTELAWECDRECLLTSPALSLAELLEREVPGLTSLRGEYFGGPHHLLNGSAGPGFLRLLVDGREVPPLESGQVDLTRVSLVELETVRVVRRAAGVQLELQPRRQRTPEAYSRITGLIGRPELQALRGTFMNRAGRDFTLGGWFDLVDATFAGRENGRFGIGGRVGWMPGTNRVGLELSYRNQDVQRSAADTTEFDRRELFLRARADLLPGLQGELRVGTTQWRPPEDEADGGTDDGDGEEDDGVRRVREAAAVLRGGAGPVGAEAELRLLDGGAAYPSVVGSAAASVRVVDGVVLEAGGERASWEDFSTGQARAGAFAALAPGVPVRLGAWAERGTRGVPRPAEDTADTVGFRGLAAQAEVDVGPYTLGGRWSWQDVERSVPFGTAFDRALPPTDGVEVTTYEGTASGPALPVGLLIPGLSPIRARGMWREHRVSGAALPLYVPERVLRGELLFEDAFFDGALHVWLAGSVTRRSAMLSASTTGGEPVTLGASTWGEGHLSFRIGHFRFFWRLVNPAGLTVADVAGLEFPSQVNVVGVKWEFIN